MTFDFTPTDDGLRIHDQIEQVWSEIDAGGRIEPEPASTDAFTVPVDDAVRFEASSLTFSTGFITRVYDDTHGVRAVLTADGHVEHATVHEVDCTPSGMKAYVRVQDTGIEVQTDQTTTLAFDGPRTVHLGTRSNHERPAGVVTTSQSPTDVMRAVSTFGSALKTLSPERSFPTLRGHPPELAVKSSLQIPDHVSPPDTGITVTVPESYDAIFTVAPLAYYLGATIRAGPEPILHAAGRRFPLDDPDLATGVARTLHQCFVLDCIVRTVGLYPVALEEHERVAEHVDVDPADLYDRPIDERTAAYLAYPAAPFTDRLPWPTVTDVAPRVQHADLLPYLTYRLSAIRSPPRGTAHPAIAPDGSTGDDPRGPDDAGATTPVSVVTPAAHDAHHSGWVGDGTPRSGVVPTLPAFVAALDGTATGDAIDVHVVCTDDGMADEVRSLYQTRPDQPLDVTVSLDATTATLAAVLDSDADLLHFVGHSTRDGLQCTDGVLDVRTLDAGRYPAFFLNGCRSYEQGLALARKGSVGGLVSLEEIRNEDAITAGRTIANLLAFGCSFGQVLTALRRWSSLAYTAIGDGDYHLVAPEDYTPILLEFEPGSRDGDEYCATYRILGETGREVGSISVPKHLDDASYTLRPTYSRTLTYDEFVASTSGPCPFVVDDTLHWTTDVDADRFHDLLRE